MAAAEHDKDDLEARLLAVRCQLGEPDALDELIEKLHLRLWAYLQRLLGERHAAEDALQETWLRVMRGLPGLRRQDRFYSWIFGIAHHVAVDALRRRRREVELDDGDALEMPAAADEGEDLRERWRELEQHLLELPFALREALTLFYLEAASLQKIAEITEVPVGTVKSRLFRARQLLLERYGRKGKAR